KIDVELANFTLFDAATTGAGLLDQGAALAADGGLQDVAEAAGDGTNEAVVAPFSDVSAGFTLDEDDAIKFDLVYNGETTTITIDKAVVDTALSATDGNVASAAEMVTVLTKALQDAGFDTTAGTGDLTVAANGNAVEITHTGVTASDTLEIANSGTSDNGNFFGVSDIDISDVDDTTLQSYIDGVNLMLESVTSAASSLGAIKSRIDMQNDFVSNLMDAIDRGVSQLVDADMEEESTKLQALQVQQQLGIQALSIAN